MQLDKARQARLDKALDKQYRFIDRGVTTIRELIESGHVIKASSYVREYENHKRGGCYKELSKPVTEYTLWFQPDGLLGCDCPKIVYDYFLQGSN